MRPHPRLVGLLLTVLALAGCSADEVGSSGEVTRATLVGLVEDVIAEEG